MKSICQNLQLQVVPSDQIKSNPFVSSIMYIPLQCATLTALYIEKWRYRKVKAYAPTTLTEIYTDLFLSSLIRYVSDHPVHRKLAITIKLKTEVKLPDYTICFPSLTTVNLLGKTGCFLFQSLYYQT